MTSAKTLPAPGPGTIRLALIRAALEIYEKNYVGRILFPIIAQSETLISSPERIGVSGHLFKMLKYDDKTGKSINSIGYREYCHTNGTLKVYIHIPSRLKSSFVKLLELIRYWGQSESLTGCVSIDEREPVMSECAQPMTQMSNSGLRDYVVCLMSDLRKGAKWKDVVEMKESAIELNLYVWPLTICERQRSERLLLRSSLEIGK
jgi:hypothetical protein